MTSIYSSLLWKYRALGRGLSFQLHHSCFSLSKKARRYSRMEEGMKTKGQKQWSVEERSLKAGTWTRHFHWFPFRQYLVTQLWWVASEIEKLTFYYGAGMLCTQVKSDNFGKKRMNLGPPLDLAAKTRGRLPGRADVRIASKENPKDTQHQIFVSNVIPQ